MTRREMFYQGTVYLLRGECSYATAGRPFVASIAYKIGATSQTPESRAYMAKCESWQFRENVSLVHTIAVDNMRVVELMFHRRFHKYAVAQDRNCEWFLLQSRTRPILRYESIEVSAALCDIAQTDEVHPWWKSLTSAQRIELALDLWKHPLLCAKTRW